MMAVTQIKMVGVVDVDTVIPVIVHVVVMV